MNQKEGIGHRLDWLAKKAMQERGLDPYFSPEALQQASHIQKPAPLLPQYRDLSSLLWCSIDNDDSRDLDQLTYGEQTSNQTIKLYVAIADVSALVDKDTPIDLHAQKNTTSVYTPSKVFPMLPSNLSTDLSSLAEHQHRVALVIEMKIDEEGTVIDSSIFQAIVHNHAQLTYRAVGEWLEGQSPVPEKIKDLPKMQQTIKIQEQVTEILRKKRFYMGALTLAPAQLEAKVVAGKMELRQQLYNRAHQLIEECMIAANREIAGHLMRASIPTIQRAVQTPKNWNRIVEVAAHLGESLPEQPDSLALNQFLRRRQQADPNSFPDLSLTVIKLLGHGEYLVTEAGHFVGHFSLGLANYMHFTAPNRRFPDLLAQRQYKANLNNTETPYALEELYRLAAQCTLQEDAATKVERQLNKSAIAILLSSQIGNVFEGIITGAGPKGIWVRISQPSVEGKIVQGFEHTKVGDKVSVVLKEVNIEKGFIDFVRF